MYLMKIKTAGWTSPFLSHRKFQSSEKILLLFQSIKSGLSCRKQEKNLYQFCGRDVQRSVWNLEPESPPSVPIDIRHLIVADRLERTLDNTPLKPDSISVKQHWHRWLFVKLYFKKSVFFQLETSLNAQFLINSNNAVSPL